MKYNLLEILGVFLAVAGAGTVVGAAALVSTALAVLVAGVFLLLAGVLTVVVAAGLERADTARTVKAGRRTPGETT